MMVSCANCCWCLYNSHVSDSIIGNNTLLFCNVDTDLICAIGINVCFHSNLFKYKRHWFPTKANEKTFSSIWCFFFLFVFLGGNPKRPVHIFLGGKKRN